MKQINIYKYTEDAIIPTRNKEFDAGLDLYANEDVFIPIGETKVVSIGVAIQIDEGYEGKIEDRSSMAAKGLRTGAGVIDAGYAGNIGIVLHNLTNRDVWDFKTHKDYGYKIKKGDKIAQIVIHKIETPRAVEIKTLWNSERGDKGYGSSGI